jgi:hypothetical protein
LDFDLQLTAGDGQTTEFAVTTTNMAYTNKIVNDGIASGYLFKLAATNSTTWSINDGDTFTIPKATWVHITVNADTDAGKAEVKITNGGTVIYNKTITIQDKGTLQGLYIRGGRYNSVTCIDNITVKKTSSAAISATATESSSTTNASTSTGVMNLVYTYEEDDDGSRYYFVSKGSTASGSIEIPSTVNVGGTSYPVVAIEENAFLNQTSLVSVTLPDSIQIIGYGAFQGCTALTSITIPKNVGSIDKWAFCDCTGLTTVTIKSATAKINEEAFWNCPKLTTVYASGTSKTGMEGQVGLTTSDTTQKLNYIVTDNSSN